MRRRDFLRTVGTLPVAAAMYATGQRASAAAAGAFSAAQVQEQARALAAQKFASPPADLPLALQSLSYDQYRDIRFKREQAIWSNEKLPFLVELFHRGFFFREPVAVFLVADGQARRLMYSPDLFTFGPRVPQLPDEPITDFAGFRLRATLNRPNYFDEFTVFQGASYFRAVARRQVYGLSARGLALNTGTAAGEEFPAFRTFWIEKPNARAEAIVVHALLDSPSTTGAYRFTIRPGNATVMDVDLTLYPRVELPHAGLAPLTSMFLFGPNDRLGADDFRPAVHDSDGLAIWNGKGEWLWRPLYNPETLQSSAFVDLNPRGFGLLQRHRALDHYQDLEAQYEQRPSLWVETLGHWGEGTVQLIEIPSASEANDNIAAFWQPARPIAAQTPYRMAYRLHWCWTPPQTPPGAVVADTRIGVGPEKGTRLIVLDFVGGRLAKLRLDTVVEPVVTASAGTIQHPVAHPNPAIKGWRVSFVLAPGKATVSDLRCTLMQGTEQLSEVWLYRWTT